MLGQLLLEANGFDLGKANREFLEKKGLIKLVQTLKDLQAKHGYQIEFPSDVAEEVDGIRVERNVEELPCKGLIMDIGGKTVESYKDTLKNARTIVVKGPAGVYEKQGFEVGTYTLLGAVKELKSKAYTLIGGGDTSIAVLKLGFKPEDFSYVSIAGGALISYLTGKDLPGVRALKETSERKNS